MTAEFLTACAAALAALLSGISLLLTRRWQQRDLEQTRVWQERDLEQERLWRTRTWALDALKQALIDHINLSFKIGRTCNDAMSAKAMNDTVKLNKVFGRAVVLHGEYMDLMVYLRLLSTPEIVTSAENLHESLDVLLDTTFAEQIMSTGRKPFLKEGSSVLITSYSQAKADCMKERQTLINAAREYLDLPRNAVINRAI